MNKYTFFSIIILGLLLVIFSCKKDEKNEETINDTNSNPLAFSQANIDTIYAGDSADAMRIMNIFLYPDTNILRNSSTEVDLNDSVIQRLTDRMYTTVKVAGGAGIAAPQVGINKRITWLNRYDKSYFNPPTECYLNIKILNYSDTVQLRWDGCLSVPQNQNYPVVVDSSYRAIWVDVAYYTLDGEYVEERINHAYTAHVFQHEVDHLNGILYMDRYIQENKSIYFLPPQPKPKDLSTLLKM